MIRCVEIATRDRSDTGYWADYRDKRRFSNELPNVIAQAVIELARKHDIEIRSINVTERKAR
jgi:hypothetical protein